MYTGLKKPAYTCNTVEQVHSVAQVYQIKYHTHTCSTCFRNTTGFHIPMLNPDIIDDLTVGFATDILQVQNVHTVPEPLETIPVPGTGVHRPVKIVVLIETCGIMDTYGLLV